MIREYQKNDFTELLRLRNLLYFDDNKNELYDELHSCFQGDPYYDLWTIFVYQRNDGSLGGFIEIGFVQADEYKDRLSHFINTDYYEEIHQFLTEGKSIPVVESWYVDDDLRGQHIGYELMVQAEEWVKKNACPFILSDTDDFRDVSQIAHKSFGYDEYHIDKDGCHYFYKRTL